MKKTWYLEVKAVAVEVYCVNVYFIAHSNQIPADIISNMHSQTMQISKHLSINGWKEGKWDRENK